MIDTRPCGCRTIIDGSGHVVLVSTCPRCLPPGAITWLIENGRQLDLFEDGGTEAGAEGMLSMSRDGSDDSPEVSSDDHGPSQDGSDLPF